MTPAPPRAAPAPASAREARIRLAIFAAVLLATSAPLLVSILRSGGQLGDHSKRMFALACSPGVAALVAAFARRPAFRPLAGPRLLSRPRAMLVGWSYPIAVALVSALLGLATGTLRFEPATELSGIVFSGSGAARFAQQLALTSVLGLLLSAPIAIGEELGWRGFLLPALARAGAPAAVTTTGLVWVAWHAPLVLAGAYEDSGPLGPAFGFFVCNAMLTNVVAARLTLRSVSVLPAMLLHAAWNPIFWLMGKTFPPLHPALRLGELGVITVAANAAITALVWFALRERVAAGAPDPTGEAAS